MIRALVHNSLKDINKGDYKVCDLRDTEEEEFPVHEDLVWMAAPDNCKIGWRYKNGEFIPKQPNSSDGRYYRKRSKAYPSIEEQLDMQYHDQVNGTTKWKDAITKVKSDIPVVESEKNNHAYVAPGMEDGTDPSA